MTERACRTCGLVFPSVNGKLYCSPTCKGRRRRRTHRPCDWCAHPFQPVKAEQRYCSVRCARQSNSPNASAIPWANCPTCDRAFIQHRRQVYCSTDCRPPAYQPTAGTPCEAECCTCGVRFPTTRSQGRYQCQPCRAEAHRQHKRNDKRRRRTLLKAARSATYRDADIFERDGWTCQLCGKRLGTNSVPDPTAPTIDHVIPLSAGGLDDRANVQAAHFLCNSLKGNKVCGSQLRLVG